MRTADIERFFKEHPDILKDSLKHVLNPFREERAQITTNTLTEVFNQGKSIGVCTTDGNIFIDSTDHGALDKLERAIRGKNQNVSIGFSEISFPSLDQLEVKRRPFPPLNPKEPIKIRSLVLEYILKGLK